MTSPEDLPPLTDEDVVSIAKACGDATDLVQWELEMRDKN